MVILYLAVTLGALIFFNFMAIRMVKDYLLERQVADSTQEAERMAVETTPLLAAGDPDALYDYACENSRDIGGRVLIVDRYGVVQTDAFSTLNGIQLAAHTEIVSVLTGASTSAYELHELYVDEAYEPSYGSGPLEKLRRWLSGERKSKLQWVLYCAAPIVSDDNIIGAVVLSTSVQGVVDRINRLRFQFNFYTAAICLIMTALNILLSGAIIRPVRELTRGIRILGQGHFSHRVQVRGRSEFAHMAETFNAMSERLENIDRMRTQFVSNASHELKTPLSSVKILVQSLLSQQPFNPEMTREFLGDIESEVDRMTALVGDLLVLVRMDEESGKQFEPVDFSMIVDEAAASLDPMANQKGVGLRIDVEEGLTVNGEGAALHQMVVNLVDNAIKYTPAEGTVSVQLARRNREIMLRVKDTGIGIADKDIPYIFDRFYRVDKARDRQTGGTGLGLSIVKGIVARHGGVIDVISKVGQGTEMIVVLPGAPQAADS
jgi:signal transduction histidine kinase